MGYESTETFSEALGVCLEGGGALMGVKSASQNLRVQTLLQSTDNIKSLWIDLVDESIEGLWLDHDSMEGSSSSKCFIFNVKRSIWKKRKARILKFSSNLLILPIFLDDYSGLLELKVLIIFLQTEEL